MKTETSKDAERKKVSVGLGDATAQEMVTTPSGTYKPTHEVSGQGEEAMTVDAPAAPAMLSPDGIKVEKIGDEMFMRDDAGNLIKLYITPLTTTTPPPAPTVETQPPSDKKSHRSEAAEGMDVDPATEKKTTTTSVKRTTCPISQRKSATAKSTERSSLHNFRGYGAVDLGDDDQPDDGDDPEDSYIGMDASPAINTALPPKSYTLPRDHPYNTDFLSAEEKELLDA